LTDLEADITERKKTETTLKEKQEDLRRLATVVSDSNDAVILHDLDGKILAWNRGARETYGYTEAEALGKNVRDIVAESDREAALSLIERIKQGEVVKSFELRRITKDGRILDVWLTTTLLTDETGKPVAIATTERDITERTKAEIALKEKLEHLGRLATVVSDSNDAVILHDLEGKILAWNRGARETYGYTEAEALGKNVRDIVAEPDREAALSLIERIKRGEVVKSFELRRITKDGRILDVWLTTTLLTDESGKPVAIATTERDITDIKRTEEALRASEHKFRETVFTLDEAYYSATLDGKLLEHNQAFSRMLRFESTEDLRGFNLLDFWQDPDQRTEYVKALAATGSVANYQIAAKTQRGETITVLASAHLVKDEQNRSQRIEGVFLDITERTKLHQELAHMASFPALNPYPIVEIASDGSVRFANAAATAALERLGLDPDVRQFLPTTPEELKILRTQCELVACTDELVLGAATFLRVVAAPPGETSLYVYAIDITERKQAEAKQDVLQAQLLQSEKMEAIGKLASGIAHDFNNQLTGILGNVALMRSSVAPGDPVLEYVNGVELGARHAADLTMALLTFCRSAIVLPVPLDPTAAVGTALSIARQSLPATMGIARDFEPAPWHILMDLSQLTQILLNLALNARDAMAGKGTLTVRVRNAVVDEAYVQANVFARTGDFVRLTVADTGPGMPPVIMSRLFEPFYTTKPAGTGTGLGLAVVYGAVKQAGGWITVDSLPGTGATFDIFLPRCLDEPLAPVTGEVATAQVCSATILVVEDEPIVSTVTQALLTRSGYTVLTAQDGASGLAALKDHAGTVDLVLLDMTMPGITTDEVLRGIRALDPTVPVLLTSGYTSSSAVKHMLEEGTAQGFLAKPYDLQQLVRSIASALNRA
jgi:two-component system cell cycle sensor histidine kinase/response regulator CckA